jgi:cobalt/nickel transport system permease protein
MSSSVNSLYNIRHLDDLARKETPIHRIHALAKLIATVAFLIAVASFGRYEIGSLLTFFFYPVIIFSFSELPVLPILKRILIVSPFIIGIGILNPLFEKQTFILGGATLSLGWITFLINFRRK